MIILTLNRRTELLSLVILEKSISCKILPSLIQYPKINHAIECLPFINMKSTYYILNLNLSYLSNWRIYNYYYKIK